MNEEIRVELDEKRDGIILFIPEELKKGTLRTERTIEFRISKEQVESMLNQINEKYKIK